jgi:hypothetical protein
MFSFESLQNVVRKLVKMSGYINSAKLQRDRLTARERERAPSDYEQMVQKPGFWK